MMPKNRISERCTFTAYLTGVSAVRGRLVGYLRLPRVVMALVAGAALSVSGVLMQAITRNPLVSPYTIGVSSAAGFGASVAIMFGIGLQAAGVYFVPLSAFVCALLCALAVFSLSWWRGMGHRR